MLLFWVSSGTEERRERLKKVNRQSATGENNKQEKIGEERKITIKEQKSGNFLGLFLITSLLDHNHS